MRISWLKPASWMIAGLFVVSSGGWGAFATTTAAAASPIPCRPSFEPLIAAMASGIPSDSPIWGQAQSAMAEGGGGGPAGIDAMLSVLSQNHYTWDCATNQLIGPGGAVVGGTPVSSTGSSGSSAEPSNAPAGSGPSSGTAHATGSAQSGANATGQGVTGAGGIKAGSGSSTVSNGSLASSQSPDNRGTGVGSTLPMIAALVLSTAMVVFVSFRHYRRA